MQISPLLSFSASFNTFSFAINTIRHKKYYHFFMYQLILLFWFRCLYLSSIFNLDFKPIYKFFLIDLLRMSVFLFFCISLTTLLAAILLLGISFLNGTIYLETKVSNIHSLLLLSLLFLQLLLLFFIVIIVILIIFIVIIIVIIIMINSNNYEVTID